MSSEMTAINIWFENGELVTVPAKYIVFVYVHGIKESFKSNWEHEEQEEIHIFKKRVAENLYLVIRKSAAGVIRTDFDTELFERFNQWKDLVGIEPKYSDGTSEEIYLPWKEIDFNNLTNGFQKNSFDEHGNLVIEVQQNWNEKD